MFKVHCRNDFVLIGMVKRTCVLIEDRQTLSIECEEDLCFSCVFVC